jgi:cyclase
VSPANTEHVRVLRPAEGVLAFYDGRVEGYQYSPEPNWVDEGAISLGIASYALIEGDEALVYDTHVSVAHAELIQRTLEAEGVRRITVLLSHWHLDHVAGTEAFAECEILAGARTDAHLRRHREAIEAGTLWGAPEIAPLILPTRTYEGRMKLQLGSRNLELIEVDIHSDDATVIWDPERRLLFAGDTVEDPITYVDEPDHLPQHLRDLEQLRALDPELILPAHGDPEIIAAGGYGPGLLQATTDYVQILQRCREEPALREAPLAELLAPSLEAGWVRWFDAYEAVHRENVETVLRQG